VQEVEKIGDHRNWYQRFHEKSLNQEKRFHYEAKQNICKIATERRQLHRTTAGQTISGVGDILKPYCVYDAAEQIDRENPQGIKGEGQKWPRPFPNCRGR